MKRALSRKNVVYSAPIHLRRTVGKLLAPVPLPWLLGRSFRRQRRFLRAAQWWQIELAERHQLALLRKLLTLAYEKTRFYRHAFEAIGFHPKDLHSLETMRGLPTTNRRTVNENIADMCTKSIFSPDVDELSTGGTDGLPLRFYANASRSAVEYAYLAASWERVGCKLGMSMAVLRGGAVRSDQNGLYHEYDPILRRHFYNSFHMSDENMGRYVEHMATIGPCFLHVYPSTITALARFIRRQDVKVPQNIQGIIAESEIVYPEQRKMVEEVFRCRYFSCYGHTEKLVLASECERSHDYHVWPTYGYCELLDEAGDPVRTPGQRGEIVGTGFINTVMPFIRYRTGDWATYVGDRCEACGREHVLLRDIRGHRTQEVLVAADGSEISWTALNMHDDTFMRVRQFQFVQEAPGRAVLRVVPGEGYGESDARRIQRNLGQKLDGQLTFTIESVEAIGLTAGGKAIYVDQRIARTPVGREAAETP